MVTSRQVKEKIRDYRRSVKHSWQLFRESRIGMVGLTIMVFFIIMALVSPYLGLRHPLDWLAPDEDILDMTSDFEDIATRGPPIDMNFKRRSGVPSEADHYYVAAGYDIDDPFNPLSRYPLGLYAYSRQGGMHWSTPFPTYSNISTNIHVGRVSLGVDYVMFGCENGMLYLLRDSERDTAPVNYHSVQLNGAVVGVSSSDDIIVATTENGWLYTFRMTMDDVLVPLFDDQISDVSLSRPAIFGNQMFVGDIDGWLYGFEARTGVPIEEWSTPYRVSEMYWSGSPVIDEQNNLIYAATDNGLIHCVYSENRTAKENWVHLDENFDSNLGYRLENRQGIDGGNLTDPVVHPGLPLLFVGSDTGFLYVIETSYVREFPFDTRIGLQDTSIEVSPGFSRRLGLNSITAAARHFNGTADPSDDFSLIYNLKIESSLINDYLEGRLVTMPEVFNISWRKVVDGVVVSTPVIEGASNDYRVVFATVFYDEDGIPDTGKMFSYNSAGDVITPLPPTWVTKEGHEEPKYRPPPSGNKYWLGTDTQGHDILGQTVLGSRIALLVGFLSAFFSISIGVIFGLVSGYYGKGIDAVLMRFTDVILVLPALPLLITFAAIMNPSIWNIILIISLVGWGGVARVIRAEVLSLKERPFIDAARVTGASKSRIMFKHIAPNVLPLGLLYMTFAISGAILFEAALSFIGLGDPSTMTWGMMLNYVQHSNALTNWWWLLPPGICITLVCLAFFLLGRAFDEIVNPRLRRRR